MPGCGGWCRSIALGVMNGAVVGPKAQRYLQFAANMTQACFQLYNATASGAWGMGYVTQALPCDGPGCSTASCWWDARSHSSLGDGRRSVLPLSTASR